MSVAAGDESPALVGPAARQAAAMLRLASRVLGDLPAVEARAAVSAVRGFIHAPTPAHYLAAVRALREAERHGKLNALGRTVHHRRTEEGLDILARSASLAPELLGALSALPPDARNRRRLILLAEMLTAHRLIDARATGAQRELRRALGPLPRPSTGGRRPRTRARAARRA